MITQLEPKQLRRAADLQERILELQVELTDILGAPATQAEAPEQPKRRKFSAAAKAKMRKAQKERWAKIKGETATEAPAPKNGRKKRTMSAAARAAVSAAQKARWAKLRGEKAPAKAEKKGKRNISAAVRKARSERMKAMWAKRRAQGKKSL
jgi:hypothetical protein